MTNKLRLVLLPLLLVLGLSACALDSSSTPSDTSTNVTSSTSSVSNGDLNTVCAQVQYKEACQMVVRRYQYMNDANKYGYFYGFVQGVSIPVIEYVVQGGIFPTSDLVSNPNYQEPCTDHYGSTEGRCAVVLDKQQPDGSFGTNGTAMFGFRADGAYFEWDGPYAYSETPLSFVGQKIEGCKSGVPGC